MLTYWFWPNPGNAAYTDTKVLAAFAIAFLLLAGSFGVSMWRRKQQNAITKKLSRSWASAMRWFGAIAIVLVVARVEEIQFLGMRFLWLLWILGIVLFALVQLWLFRKKHYVVVPKEQRSDPRAKYLPKQ